MIEVERLSKSFGERMLWRDITLTVGRGEMLALTGPSGSGKSTLLNCLGLLDRPSSGVIRHEGKDITRFGKREARLFRRDTLGYLFQGYALIENATIEENLEVAVKPRRALRGKVDASFTEALQRVGLAGRHRDTVHRLSGGEQQRVALARLIVQQPKLVLADEPTAALDRDNTVMVLESLRDMTRAGCTVVIATHDDTVRDACDNVFDVGAPLEAKLS
ncbi:ABC transporter ATP-binding protein [Streptomyces fradiae]|uniref:ABC transporter ATP-binding protein n=1 Tax=Streptomyces fradiae TaxID=1906 RepID=UPI003515A22E